MTSEIKVDTISEQTSANGVTIDGLTIKDGNIIGDVALAGTTPTFTIGDGGAEDAALIFDGNAVDFVVGLDDSADEFRIGVGSGLGSDRVFEINSSGDTTFQKPVFFAGSSPSVTIGDGGAEDTKLVFDGNAQDFYIALDDSADDLVIGTGSTVGSNVKMVIENGGNVGIGTSSPGSVLQIDAASTPKVTIRSADGTSASLKLQRINENDASTDFELKNDGGVLKIIGDNASQNEREIAKFETSAITFNEGSEDIDFRVESNGEANMLFVDAGNDRVHVNGSTGTREFNVSGDNTRLLLYSTNNSTGAGQLQFGDADNEQIGRIMYEHDGNKMTFHTNNTEQMRIHSGGNVSIGSTSDPAALSVTTGNSSVSPSSDADEFFVEGSGNAGVSIGSGTSSTGNIFFADSGDNAIGKIVYNHNGNSLAFTTNASERMRIDSGGETSTGGETAPDVTVGGLCLNQGADDTNILGFKSSDIAHGITSADETDTFFAIRKQSATLGGAQFRIYSERTGGEHFQASVNGAGGSTTKSSSAVSNIMWTSSQKSGTGINAVGTNDNIFSIHNYINTRFIFDAEGDFHADSSSTTYDAYDDAQLVRAFDLSHGKGVINSKFDEYVKYKHEDLADAGLVGREDDGTPNHFINVTGFQRLHNGAIWQQYEKHQKLASAFYKLAEKTIGKEEADKLLTEEEIQLLN